MLRIKSLQLLGGASAAAHLPVTAEVSPDSIYYLVGDPETSRNFLYALGGMLREVAPDANCIGEVTLDQNTIGQTGGFPGVVVVSGIPENQLSGIKDTPIEEVALPLEVRGLSPEVISGVSSFFLTALGLGERVTANINTLSGGEVQRVNFCAALSADVRALLLDSAYEELDPTFRAKLNVFLRCLSRAYGFPIIAFDVVSKRSYSATDRTIVVTREEMISTSTTRPAPAIRFNRISQEPKLVLNALSTWPANLTTPLFKPLSFALHAGECKLLVGPNGIGKTTVLRYLAGINRTSLEHLGSSTLDGVNIDHLKWNYRQNAFAISFQNPDLYFCRPTVHQELNLGRPPNRLIEDDLFEALGIGTLGNANPLDLSRSQRKRLSVFLAARARRPILLLDEPTQGFADDEIEYFFKMLICVLTDGAAVLCVTHDDRVINAFKEEDVISFAKFEKNPNVELRSNTSYRGQLKFSNSWRKRVPSTLRDDWTNIHDQWTEFLPDILGFWETNIYPWLDKHLQSLIENRLSSQNALPIEYVDLGCGNGLQTAIVASAIRRFSSLTVMARGFDWAPNAVEIAKYVFSSRCGVSYTNADITEYEFPVSNQKFLSRLVTAFFVLHDIPYVNKVLANISKSRAKQDIFLATVINPYWAQQSENFKLQEKVADRLVTDADAIGTAMLSSYGGRELFSPFFFRSFRTYSELFRKAGLELEKIWFLNDGVHEFHSIASLLDDADGELVSHLATFPACAFVV